MIKNSPWQTIGRPGWFGEERNRILDEYDQLYGHGNWRIRHQLGSRTMDFDESVKIYELCYELDFLHPDRRYIWNELIDKSKEVWTEQWSDLESGTNYYLQNALAAHYEDVAIRRILHKYDLKFKGKNLTRIRADSDDLVGRVLSSIHIKFIYPEYIEDTIDDQFHWWDRHKGSLECFWHLNKILQIKVH